MKNTRKFTSLLRLLLLSLVVAGGIASIIASNGNDCVEVGESCSENSDCCHNHCEGGRCCRGIGADLASEAPASVCCSGQIRTGPYGPYCCGTDGMVVSSDDRCCEGLERNPRTGACIAPRCPPGCTWRDSASVVGGGECECPPSGGGGTPEIPPCSSCDVPSESNCWFYRVYHEGYTSSGTPIGTGCRTAGPFQAPNEAAAVDCARRIAAATGLSSDRPWVVEDISDTPGQECHVP